jgi:hypothetical protein
MFIDIRHHQNYRHESETSEELNACTSDEETDDEKKEKQACMASNRIECISMNIRFEGRAFRVRFDSSDLCFEFDSIR